ncbi:MAG TPA: hypothetical protein VF588_15470 [Pyrinomonadaceae bacterium]|jgi:hypothetical protein
MSKLRKALAAVLILALLALAWLWFTRPGRVDMAAYAPADSIVYAEANSLPEVFDAFTSTDAWRELAPAAGVDAAQRWKGWLPGFVSFTGLGPSDVVVLSRAQVAVSVLGFRAAEESGATLKLSPRVALVAETHTSEWRVRAAVEKLVGGFARRSMGAPPVERKEVDGVPFYTWAESAGARRKVVAAVEGSVAVVGNDEAAVRACLDVRRGARPSLAGDEGLREMRGRLGGDGALAFGYAPRGSVAKAAEVFAPALVAGVTDNASVQSFLATTLPQLFNQTLGALGWSARLGGGGIEDTYALSLAGGMPQRLQAPFATSEGFREGAAALLPTDTHAVTFYDFRSPEDAWRGLSAAFSSQVDILSARLITSALEGLAGPYGVKDPRAFLRACGGEVATARLEEESEGKVLVASVRDRAAIRAQALAYLGRGASSERVGDAELLVSNDPDRGAAAFVGDFVLTGAEGDVRRCLDSRQKGQTLREGASFGAPSRGLFEGPAFARTLTDERAAARSVLALFGRKADAAGLEKALARRAYSLSETRLGEGGFEIKTRSSFGWFGYLVTRPEFGAAPRGGGL